MPTAFYGFVLVLLGLCVSRTLPDLMPTAAAHHVANDSEGYLLALVLAAWVEGVRPVLFRRATLWWVTAAAALTCLVLGVALYRDRQLVSSVRTLNETWLALAVLLPYASLRVRPSPRAAALLSAGVVAVTAVLMATPLVTLTRALAEGVVMLALAPLALDVFDPAALHPADPGPLRRRQAWWAALVVLPLVFIVLRHAPTGAVLHDAVDYGARAQEAFVGFLLLGLYFSLRAPARAGAPSTVKLPRPRAVSRPRVRSRA